MWKMMDWQLMDNYIWIAFMSILIILLLAAKPFISRAFDYYWPKLMRTGKKSAEQTAQVFSDRHQFQSVTPQDFPGKDLSFYESTQRMLEGQNFRWLGDLEDLTLTKTHPKMRTFIRCMLSADGTVSAGIYDVELKGWMKILQMVGILPKKLQVLDLETEFNDATFLCTSNSKELDQLDAPPSIRKMQYPQETDLMDLLNVHHGVIAQWTAQDEAYLPLQVSSLEEGIEAQHRMQDLQNTFRHEIGLLSREELERISGGKETAFATTFDMDQIIREHQRLASGELQVNKPEHFKNS